MRVVKFIIGFGVVLIMSGEFKVWEFFVVFGVLSVSGIWCVLGLSVCVSGWCSWVVGVCLKYIEMWWFVWNGSVNMGIVGGGLFLGWLFGGIGVLYVVVMFLS